MNSEPVPDEDSSTALDPTQLDLPEYCATCGRELGWDGLPPVLQGTHWICGACDAANQFDEVGLNA